jgi:cellulose synthase/poly-beta-1,6-N-acetylglucosamine synthase-like glycosyltransferase
LYDLGEHESAALRAGQIEPDALDLSGREAGRAAIGENLVLCGGAFAMRRDAFVGLGGWDERFLGWGGEDDALSYKLQRRRLSTVELDESAALHLWHPRPPARTLGQPHYRANQALLEGYRSLDEPAFERLLEVQQQRQPRKYRPRPAAMG